MRTSPSAVGSALLSRPFDRRPAGDVEHLEEIAEALAPELGWSGADVQAEAHACAEELCVSHSLSQTADTSF